MKITLPLSLTFILSTLALGSALAQAPPDPCVPIFQRLKSFGFADKFGEEPVGNLVMDAAGTLYGATEGNRTAGAIFKLTPNQTGGYIYTTLQIIPNTGGAGDVPATGPLLGSNGKLYGTTIHDGIFKMNSDGTGFKILHVLSDSEGFEPFGTLCQAQDGAIYGTAQNSGTDDPATLFKFNPDGSDFHIVYYFNFADGIALSGVIPGTDGKLYGTAVFGGTGSGSVFSWNPAGGEFERVHEFAGPDGANPAAGLIQGSDGAFYGTTKNGGSHGFGTVFKVNADGSGFGVIWDADGIGGKPAATLARGPDGAIYGTTGSRDKVPNILSYEGGSDFGTVFKLTPDGLGGYAHIVLTNFSDNGEAGFSAQDGRSPNGLLLGPDGALYGSSWGGGNRDDGVVFKLDATGFKVLWNFDPLAGDGQNPVGGLVQGIDGAFYGLTDSGGINGLGTVFKIDSDGRNYTQVYQFGSSDPRPGGLIRGANGAFYGTASGGSANSGTVIGLDPDGTHLRVLWEFGTTPDDGANPAAALLQTSDGTLYGTTTGGGSVGRGTVFKLNPDGTGYQVLTNFADLDMSGPFGGLLQGTDNALYGTTIEGGPGYTSPTYGDSAGGGTVFRLNPDGSGLTVLHSFSDCFCRAGLNELHEGAVPLTTLLQGSDGALYGMTSQGGSVDGPDVDEFFTGSVFKLNPDGTGFAVMNALPAPSGLVKTRDGAIYWESSSEGLYRLAPDASLSHFTFFPYGDRNPTPLTQGADGALYGTGGLRTGAFGQGVIYRFILSPINQLDPTSASAGGPALTLTVNGCFVQGAAVLWNGTACPTTFVSGSQLQAAISASDLVSSAEIATAKITVLNPDGSLSNPLLFTIVNASVGVMQTVLAGPNTTTSLSTPNISTPLTQPGQAAMTATIKNSGEADPIAATAATFVNNPTTSVIIDVGGGYVDLKITGADTHDSATARFYYPSTVTGAAESSLGLLYFTGDHWAPVLSSGGDAPNKDTADNLDSTVSGGRFAVTFDAGSTPKITELNGTMFTMAIADTAAPVIHCPANIVASTDAGQCSALVNYTATATDNSGSAAVVCNPTSGSRFQKGTTTVNCTATDGSGNQSSCTFTVTVNDTEKPSITSPANVTLGCSPDLLTAVTFSATAHDNCDPNPTITYSRSPGSGFPIGVTTVTCTATDASGNQSSCTLTVTRAALGFDGFASPIGGADATGGSFANPVRTIKLKSTLPVKFTAACGGSAVLSGIHRLQVIKYSDLTTAGDPIDATPTDAATTGDEFRLTGGEWHFNLDTKATGMSVGIWLLRATLSDGSQHTAWIQIK